MTSTHVKVRFLFEQTGGWPPVASEGLWALPLGDQADCYQIDNIPWFVRELALGDVVLAKPDDQGIIWFQRIVFRSGNLTIRIIPGVGQSSLEDVVQQVALLGMEAAPLGEYRLVAVNLPKASQRQVLKQLLLAKEAAEEWSYEEGLIDGEWAAWPDSHAGG